MNLGEVVHRKVKDIEVRPVRDNGTYVLKMVKVVFEDGSQLWCEGEHDLPYVIDGDVGVNEDFVRRLYHETNG